MATGPGGSQIIGKVAVRVLPDTSEFRQKAKVELEKIEKRLPKLKVQAIFDTNGLKRDILTKLRELNAEIKGKDAYKVKLGATVPKITVELDKSALKTVERELEHWKRKMDPIKLTVKPDLFNGAAAAISARLAILTRPRTVPIVPVLDSKAAAGVGTALAALSGARVLSDALDDVWDRLKNLDKAVPIIGSLAEAVAGLAGWGLTAASNLFALSASLAQIGGAGLALPGIFGGIAIGVGATVAVFKDFNKVLPGVKKQFAELQNQMSSTFWAKAKQPIRDMIDSLFPELSAGLKKTSSELGGFFANLADSLTGALNNDLSSMFDDLSESIKVASGGTDAFAGIIAKLGALGAGQLPRLAGFVVKIAKEFDRWLGKAAADGRLQGFVDTGIQALKDLGNVLAGTGRILAGLARAAQKAGGSTLGILADTLDDIQKTVNSPAFQKGLVKTLKAAHDMMSKIASGSGEQFKSLLVTISKLFQRIAPIVGNTLGTAFGAIFDGLNQPQVTNGITQMFRGLKQGVEALAPAMEPLGRMIGALGPLIGALAANLGPVLGAAITALEEPFKTVVASLVPLVNLLGPILVQAINLLAPLLVTIGEGIAEIAVAAQPLITKIGELIALVAPVLVPVLQFLAGLIVDTVIFAISGMIDVVSGVIKVFSGVIDFFTSVFNGEWGKAWEAVKQIASGIWDLIKGAFKLFLVFGMGGIFRLGGKLLKGIWRKAWQGIKDVAEMLWSSIKGRFSAFMTELKNAPKSALTALKNLFKGVWGDIKAAAQLLWEQVPKAFRQGISKLVGFVKSIPGKILAVFTGAGDLLLNAGKAVIDGLVRGISSKIGAVKDKLTGLTKKLTSWKGPEATDKKLLYQAGVFVMEGFIKGLQSRFKKVKKVLEGLTGDIPQHASDHLKKVVNESRTKLLELVGKWEDVGDKIKDTIKGIKDAAKQAAEQLSEALVALGDPTQLQGATFDTIVENLQAAVQKAKDFAAVMKTLKDLKLNATTVSQIAAAGPDALGIAQTIAAAGAAGVKQLNDLQAQLEAVAVKAGKPIEDVMFENGMNMAKGLLKGLREKRKELRDEMVNIAKAMVNAIKVELGIHSPSRVFRKLFSHVPEGAVLGVRDGIGDVEKAVTDMASMRPAVSAALDHAVTKAVAAGGSTTNKTLVYNAAPGSKSLGAEEELFTALKRARGKDW